jgi:hypothetical protein
LARRTLKTIHFKNTVKPLFTGPLGGIEQGTVYGGDIFLKYLPIQFYVGNNANGAVVVL